MVNENAEFVVNDNAENCWEYFNCPEKYRKNCKVYLLKMGKEGCYVEHLKKGCPYIRKKGIKNCFECPWFKKLNPNSDK